MFVSETVNNLYGGLFEVTLFHSGSCKRCCQCHLLLLFLWSCRVSVWQAAASKHPRFQDPILALKLSSLPNSICLFLRGKLFQLYTFFSFNTVTLEFGENFVIMEHSTIWCFQLAFLIICTLFISFWTVIWEGLHGPTSCVGLGKNTEQRSVVGAALLAFSYSILMIYIIKVFKHWSC